MFTPVSIVVFSVLLRIDCCSSWTVSTSSLEEACPEKCICESHTIRCHGSIPKSVSNHITDVEVIDLPPETFVGRLFCQRSWNNVTKLSILCKDTCDNKFPMPDNVFLCLDRLDTLRLSLGKLYNFSRDTFMGLLNATHLDLSNCLKICTPDLVTVLSNRYSLPNLSRLTFDGAGTFCTPNFKLNQVLVDLLASRGIKDINLSSTKVEFEDFNVTNFCMSVSKLNFSNSWIMYYQKLNKAQMCRSLTKLDLSRFQIFHLFNIPKHINITNYPPVSFEQPPLFSHVRTLFLNKILNDDHDIYISNTSFTYIAKNSLHELHLCGYNVISFDAELNFTFDYLKLLNLSNNKMENIGDKVLRNLKFLAHIDLAHNQLSRTQPFDKTFSKLFHNNALLEEINVENNDLTYLPMATFSTNRKLKKIKLNRNKFQQITFDVTHLTSLNLLDLRYNAIEFLNSFSRISLDKLYNVTSTSQHHQQLQDRI